MKRISKLILLLSIAQQLLAQQTPIHVVLLKGDVTNLYMDDLFDNNIFGSSNAEATYSSSSKAAVVTNIQELRGDGLESTTVGCRVSRRYLLADAKTDLLIAACGNDDVDVYTIGANNELIFDAEKKVKTGEGTIAWDFMLTDEVKGLPIALAYDGKIDATAKTGPFVTFVPKDENLFKKSVNMFEFGDFKMKDYLSMTSWTDTTTSKTLYVAFEAPLEPREGQVAKYIVWADVSDDSGEMEKTGRFDLSAAGDFCEDITGIMDIIFSDNDKMYVSYVPSVSSGISVCGCTVAYDEAENAFSIDDCGGIVGFPPATTGTMALHLPKSAEKGKAIYYVPGATPAERLLYYCDFDGERILGCNQNKDPINFGDMLEFHKIQFGPSGQEIAFRRKDIPQGAYARVVTIIYNIVKDPNEEIFTYDEISDRGGYTMCSGVSGTDVTAISLTRNAYSVYGPNPNKWYVSFVANSVVGMTDTVSITKTLDGQTESKKVEVFIRDSLHATNTAGSLPNYFDYISGTQITLPVSRLNYLGNNLDFKLAESTPPGFTLVGSHADLKVGDDIPTPRWFASEHYGVSLGTTGDVLTLFECENSPTTAEPFQCKMTDIAATIDASYEIVYITSTQFGPEEAVVIVVSNAASSTFISMGVTSKAVTQFSLEGVGITAGQAFFRMIPIQNPEDEIKYAYTMWVATDTAVNVYGSNSKDFAQFNAEPITVLDHESIDRYEGTFCPQAISLNGIDSSVIEINSYCGTSGVSRLYRFTAPSVQTIIYQSSKLMNNPEVGEGILDICHFGNEHFVYGEETKFMFSADIDDDYSLNTLGEEMLGYTEIDGIQCIEGAPGAIYYGKIANGTQMSVINGNKLGDIDNRYHTTIEYTGTIMGAVRTSYGYLVTFSSNGMTTGLYTHKAIMLASPHLSFDSKDHLAETAITIEVSQMGVPATIPSNFFKMKISEYNGKFTVEREKDFKTDAGAYELFDIAEMKGDVSGVKVDIGDLVNKTVIVTPRMIVDDGFNATASPNVIEPERIITQKTSSHMVGFRHNGVTLEVYYYESNTKFTGRENTGFDTNVYDAVLNADEFTLVTIATNEGGQHNLRWSIKKPGEPLNHGIIANDFEAHHLCLVEISSIRYALVAINRNSFKGQTWLLDVSQSSTGKYKVDSTSGTKLRNVYGATGFENGNTAVFLITDYRQNLFNVVEISDSGSYRTRQPIKPADGLKIQEAKCFAFTVQAEKEFHCIIEYLGNKIGDMVLQQNSTDYITKSYKDYGYFYDYRPVAWDFNEQFLIVKTRNLKEELMIAYNRQADSTDSYWTLSPSDYYNKAGPFTPSIPIVYSSGEITKFAFTQSNSDSDSFYSKLFRKNKNEDRGTFYQFITEKSLLILGGNLDENDVKKVQIIFNEGVTPTSGHYYPIMNFFNETNTPIPPSSASSGGDEPTEDDIPWWVWVIIGMVVFLIFVAFLLKFLTREKTDIEEEEDVYYDTKARAEMEVKQ